ncbi:ParB/RepB/Spo0J family partition protein [Streptomyces sp. NPDC046915]|uniref:ParB/RepB/Spo0J family partition protein n=1 Tax=Streptomyces sp. NPDC046915 TaxID=3155257 RepID=UPI0033F2690D
MRYQGELPTALFTDSQIRARDFHKWEHCRGKFARGRDRLKVDELKKSIALSGLKVPILLGVSDRYPDVYIGDGHHRAIALTELGVERFPFRWYWITWSAVRIASEPFPYHFLGL